jgi:hypothetical protein
LNRIVPTIGVPRYHIADSFSKEKADEAHFPIDMVTLALLQGI